MALWFPLMVNSAQIGEVSIVRRDDPISDGEYVYDWTVVDSRSVTRRRPRSGELRHTYADGAFELIRKVLNAYSETA